jgi:hypothetical protein
LRADRAPFEIDLDRLRGRFFSLPINEISFVMALRFDGQGRVAADAWRGINMVLTDDRQGFV